MYVLLHYSLRPVFAFAVLLAAMRFVALLPFDKFRRKSAYFAQDMH
jgi:hypothetical protein